MRHVRATREREAALPAALTPDQRHSSFSFLPLSGRRWPAVRALYLISGKKASHLSLQIAQWCRTRGELLPTIKYEMGYRTDPSSAVVEFSNDCEWAPAAAETTARRRVERALEDLLDVTRRRRGYSPREFVARRRAKQALRQAEPPRPRPPAADRGTARSG
jgi:hypothetical protein